MLQRLFLTLTLLLFIGIDQIGATSKDSTAKVNYMPEIHGVFRGRFQASTTESDNYRFQVRNARLNISGKIAPIADYYIQADFCDQGQIKMLDAWARIWATKEIGFQAGQFRMPFGIDSHRGPASYYFANRSFVGKQMCNYRAVGAKAMWKPTKLPISLEAGVFNPGTIGDHTPWRNTLTYSAKLTANWNNFTFATGFMSIKPDIARANILDAAISWSDKHWHVEGEYMYKHYVNDRHKPAHAYNIFANYSMPIRTGFFNQLSFQGRFDGLTNHSTGVSSSSTGEISTNHPSRNRFTIGSTISYVRSKNMHLDIRLNYENYLYHHGFTPEVSDDDKITAEIVISF